MFEWNRSRYATEPATSTSGLIHGYIPLALSYNDRTVYAYIHEDLASRVVSFRLDDSGGLEYELRPYYEAATALIPVT